jgi:hypothetical protein
MPGLRKPSPKAKNTKGDADKPAVSPIAAERPTTHQEKAAAARELLNHPTELLDRIDIFNGSFFTRVSSYIIYYLNSLN